MATFRGTLQRSIANPGELTLKGEDGKDYDLLFAGGRPKGKEVGQRIRIRGRLRPEMMGLNMGLVLEVQGVEESDN